ncbi:single-stranded DNA-specific exonuclease [Aciduliprofundum sp. MAR08-339]|uniref:single-stranded-DNA-specific exonuclease RecJ n=1 Tax=Aciduliprofundum sp. (strain MAR08-339) TaxID=673860 RepID=UPI0002A4B4B3|nr:single-stranded DNA-specific exonuclease [Aciduliprofundum sp. MAR08-339]
MDGFLKRAKEIADKIREADYIVVVSHIDADGITSGSIAARALERLNKEFRVDFVKQLDERKIEELKDENPSLVWFTDLGSGMVHLMYGLNAVITDHHVPSSLNVIIPKSARRNLSSFFEELSKSDVLQLNPHVFNREGAVDISGAGTTYFVARELDRRNVDLSALAIVGAIGDMQDSENLRLTGTNRVILKEAKEHGYVDYFLDARFFGRETRPIHKMLQYSTDPLLPTLTGDERRCISFLKSLGIPLKREKWRRWVDLSMEERRLILSELVKLILRMGYGHEMAERLIGEVYVLVREERGTPLRDAKEFATLLNACGRYNKAFIGYKVCLGDRDEYYKKALSMLNHHRKNLVEGVNFVKEIGIVKRENLQYFHAGENINENIVGIVASMLLTEEDNRDLPIIAFANSDDGNIKVSARAPRVLVDRGLDLSIIMREASAQVGGFGGGHNIAAGATIPRGKEEEFIDIVEKMIKKQLQK